MFGVDPSDVEIAVNVSGVEAAVAERENGSPADSSDDLLVAFPCEVGDADA